MNSVNYTIIGQELLSNNIVYRIEAVLGQGSFGITYKARALTKMKGKFGEEMVESPTPKAIKEFFMKEVNERNEDGSLMGMSEGSLSYNYAQKFKKEAETLATMSHPNIVKVIDFISANNTYYYVMDYIEGENLNEYLNHHKMTTEEASQIILDVTKALQYMHTEKHMLHLDLKPGNIMRRKVDGHIFLIDFGLSKHYSDEGQPETSTNIGLGTEGYAPIEQGKKNTIGSSFLPTIDIYALGATFYKLLTGQTPPSAHELVSDEKIVEHELRKFGIQEDIIEVISHAMRPSAKLRTQNTEDFRKNILKCKFKEQEDNNTPKLISDNEITILSVDDRSDKRNKAIAKISEDKKIVDGDKWDRKRTSHQTMPIDNLEKYNNIDQAQRQLEEILSSFHIGYNILMINQDATDVVFEYNVTNKSQTQGLLKFNSFFSEAVSKSKFNIIDFTNQNVLRVLLNKKNLLQQPDSIPTRPNYIDHIINPSRPSQNNANSAPTFYIIIGILFVLVIFGGIYFFSGNSKHVTIIEKDGKFGLGVDGKEIVECQYDSIWDSDMYGITPQRYLLFKDGKKGVADTLGNIILPCKYIIKQSINGYHVFEENHKQGVIDSVGNIVIDNKYNDVSIVEYDDRGGYSKRIKLLFIVKDENGLCGIINNTEQVLSPIKYKEIKHLWGFYYIDTKGRWSYSESPYGGSSAYYKHIYDMDVHNGFRAIVVDFSNKFGVISLNGTEIIKCQYDDAVLLGMSHVLVKDTSTSEWKCINKDYQVQFSITCDSVKPYIGKVIVYDKGKKKLLDESGTLEPFKL